MSSVIDRIDLGIERDGRSVAHSDSRRANSASRKESSSSLDGSAGPTILESSIADFADMGSKLSPFAIPRILSVEMSSFPKISGDLDMPLSVDEEVHVADALTGESLGSAIVNACHWAITDARPLSNRRLIAYVAYVIDREGAKGELSNVYEFVFERPSAAVRSQNARSAARATEMGFQDSAPTSIAIITQVTSQCQDKPMSALSKHPSRAKVSWGYRRILVGLLSEPLKAEETLHVFDGTIDLGIASVRGRAWSFCDTRILRIGSSLNYTAQVLDRRGNAGPVRSIVMMTVGDPLDRLLEEEADEESSSESSEFDF